MLRQMRKIVHVALLRRILGVCLVIIGTSNSVWAQDLTRVVDGVLDLNGHDFDVFGPVKLGGKWEFYPDLLVTLSDAEKIGHSDQLGHVGSGWTGVRFPFMSPAETRHLVPWLVDAIQKSDVARPGQGAGTYRLTIVNNQSREVGVYLPAVGTASRLILNDQTIALSGAPAEDALATSPSPYPGYSRFVLPAGTSTLMWQISNDLYPRGGAWDVPVFGSVSDIERMQQTAIATQMAASGLLVGMGAFLILLAISGRLGLSAYYLAAASILSAVYVGFSGSVFFGEILNADWVLVTQAKYVAIFLGVPAFLAAARLYDGADLGRTSIMALVAGAICAIATVIQPPLVFADLVQPFILIMAITTVATCRSLLARAMGVEVHALWSFVAVLMAVAGMILAGMDRFGSADVTIAVGQSAAVVALLVLTISEFLTTHQSVKQPSATSTSSDPTLSLPEPEHAYSVTPEPDVAENASVILGTIESVLAEDKEKTDALSMVKVLQDTLSCVPQSILILDENDTVIFANKVSQTLLDTPAALTRFGADFSDLLLYMARRGDLGPGDADDVAADFINLIKQEDPDGFRYVDQEDRLLQVSTYSVAENARVILIDDVTYALSLRWQYADRVRSDLAAQDSIAIAAAEEAEQIDALITQATKVEGETEASEATSETISQAAFEFDPSDFEESLELDSPVEDLEPVLEEAEDTVSVIEDAVEDLQVMETDVFTDGGPELPDLPLDMSEDWTSDTDTEIDKDFDDKDKLDTLVDEQAEALAGDLPSHDLAPFVAPLIAPSETVPLGSADVAVDIIDMRSNPQSTVREADAGADDHDPGTEDTTGQPEQASPDVMADIRSALESELMRQDAVEEYSTLEEAYKEEFDAGDQDPASDEVLGEESLSLDADQDIHVDDLVDTALGDDDISKLLLELDDAPDPLSDIQDSDMDDDVESVLDESDLEEQAPEQDSLSSVQKDDDELDLSDIEALLGNISPIDETDHSEPEPARDPSPFRDAVDPNKPLDINPNTLRGAFGDDSAAAQGMVQEHLENARDQLQFLEQAVLAADGAGARKACRSLRGASKALGLDSMVHALAGVEAALSGNAWLDAAHAVHSAQDAHARAIQQVSRLQMLEDA